MGTRYIVKLEDGVWRADGKSAVERTPVEANAKKFAKFTQAKAALKSAREYYLFASARIVAIEYDA